MSLVDIQTQKEKKKGSKGGTPVEPELAERAEKARALLGDYRSKHEASWPQLGREIGYATSSLQLFYAGNYDGNPQKIVEAIERWHELQSDRERLGVVEPAFIETSITKLIRRAVRQVRTRGRLGIIGAESGLSKSTTLRQIAKADPQKTLYILCDPTMRHSASRGTWAFLARILSVLGQGNTMRQSPAQSYQVIVEGLSNAPKMLLFDEAQFLTREALDQARVLHEAAGIPIVFAGNESIYEFGLLEGMHPAAFTQFTSRCTVVEQIDRGRVRDTDAVLLAASMVGEELATEFARELWGQTQRPGAFRQLVSVLQRAQEIGGGKVEEGHLARAIAEQDKRGGAR